MRMEQLHMLRETAEKVNEFGAILEELREGLNKTPKGHLANVRKRVDNLEKRLEAIERLLDGRRIPQIEKRLERLEGFIKSKAGPKLVEYSKQNAKDYVEMRKSGRRTPPTDPASGDC